MAVTKQLSVMVENKRGALAELCSKLAEKAINILGLMVPEQAGVAPVRLVVNNLDPARKTLDELGLKYTEEDVLHPQRRGPRRLRAGGLRYRGRRENRQVA